MRITITMYRVQMGARMIKRKNYFKGWYFKCTSSNQTISFIPAYHGGNNETASLQIITDNDAFYLPFHSIYHNDKKINLKVGNSIFSYNGIKLDIQTPTLTATGKLSFKNITPIKYDIMGPFQYIPFMQCKHSVYSMKHIVNGRITVNGKQYLFENGTGYMEGDSGCSFPSKYIWTQCAFPDGSLMLAVADIPFMGFHFPGIIGVVMIGKKEYRIATYLGAKIKQVGNNSVLISQGGYELYAKLMKQNSHPLLAPNSGNMTRTVHESASCTAHYCFSRHGEILFEFTSSLASFEYEYDAPAENISSL